MNGTSHQVRANDVNLSDPEFWAADRQYRGDAFAALRAYRPVAFFDEWDFGDPRFPAGPGYWAVTRYADIQTVSHDSGLYCSGKGSVIVDDPPELRQYVASMIMMDDPQHARLRNIVSRAFTPRRISQLREFIENAATECVDSVAERYPARECDFASEIAARLPLEVICTIMGVPPEDRLKMAEWIYMLGQAASFTYVLGYDAMLASLREMYDYVELLADRLRDDPSDNMTSLITTAEVDGERLTQQELGRFLFLLLAAGSETVRSTLSHGMKALTDFPRQRGIWFDDFEGCRRTAIEEIVRWATPINCMRRTATADTTLNGVHIKAGEKVVMFYASGNRDADQFPDPDVFDVRRPVSPTQISFGAGGAHFCLGAHLARLEIGAIFDAVRRRLPDLRVSGEPDYTLSSFSNGIESMRCAW